MNSAAAHSLAEAPPAAAPISQHHQQQPLQSPTQTSDSLPPVSLPSISSPPAPPSASLPAALQGLPPNPDEPPPLRQSSPTSPSSHYTFEPHHHQQQQHGHHLHPHPTSPPLRKDTSSSISTQATTATLASTETNNTSYSADTSPNLHQSIFSVKDGSDVSNNRRTSRRRTGPLSQQSRERAALIRKLGACNDCRRRRVACHPSHHNMTWEDVVNKFHRSHSPTIQDIAPSLAAAGRPLSPAPPLGNVQSMFTHDPQEMDIDSNTPTPNQPGRPPLSETRIRTPLPSGPRLEKSLSLPGIESLKNELQHNVGRMLSTPSRDRYTSVQALLLFWQDDDDGVVVESAVRELADVFDKYYHYTFQVQTIPSSTDGSKSSWRWLARQLNDFAEERDQRDVLKIVYYVGQTYLDGNREMVLASSREPERASTIRWSGIQSILEEASSDTLIIMDAAYYPSARMVRQRGVLELIAASVSEEHSSALDRCSFTRALAELLRTRATRLTPLSAAELHSHLFALYPKMVQDKNPEKEFLTSFPSPLHMMMSGNSRLPSIFLSPVYSSSPMRSNSLTYENSPQLHLSIRLNDDNVDVDSWNEWLRLMPEGIKDVKVEGPFRATFR
ncbi:Fc.00g004710.m01.CDS01 [Cosmosporella sp. VM-42]